jgi:hypothetical protein
MITSTIDTRELTDQIEVEFDASRSEARKIAEKASRFADHVQSNQEEWKGASEVDNEYIISKLNMAPSLLTVTAKWNYWAGVQEFLNQPDFKIS